MPEGAKAFSAAYVAEMDVLEAFIEARCKIDVSGFTNRSEMHSEFKEWWSSEDKEGKAMSSRQFYSSMTKKGYRADAKIARGTRVIRGLELKRI